ncbi:MAG: hypothetical protein M0Z66_08785 [Thermaerobacter sp.]|nr:hypothetical protein [Thermaerobacter sp.]
MKVYVGVDGGGTYTRALAFREDGAPFKEARSGPSNWQAVGLETAVRMVQEAVQEAAGLQPAGVGACLAGVDLPEDEERLAIPLREALGCDVRVDNDIIAAVHAAPGDPCGVVSSGTGAAVALRQGSTVARLLALNDYTGPIGGAGDIVTQALRAAILAAQGAAPATVLSEEIPRAFGLKDYVALARATESREMPAWQVALIVAPLCAQAAATGDAVAAAILAAQGRALGQTSGRFFTARGLPQDASIALHGSLLRGGPPMYRSAFEEGLREHLRNARTAADGLSAVLGAALYAASCFGVPAEPLRAMTREH